MSSLLRRMERKRLRKASDYMPAESPVRMRRDGGYSALHPTKGWRRVSALRAKYGREGRI